MNLFSLGWDIHVLPLYISTPGSWALGLKPEFIPLAPRFSGFCTLNELHKQFPWFSSLQMACGGDSQPPQPCKSII